MQVHALAPSVRTKVSEERASEGMRLHALLYVLPKFRLHCFGPTESSKANLIGFLSIVLPQGTTLLTTFSSCYSVSLLLY